MIVAGTVEEVVVRAFLAAAGVVGMARAHSAPELALDLALALADLALVAEAVVRACAL